MGKIPSHHCLFLVVGPLCSNITNICAAPVRHGHAGPVQLTCTPPDHTPKKVVPVLCLQDVHAYNTCTHNTVSLQHLLHTFLLNLKKKVLNSISQHLLLSLAYTGQFLSQPEFETSQLNIWHIAFSIYTYVSSSAFVSLKDYRFNSFLINSFSPLESILLLTPTYLHKNQVNVTSSLQDFLNILILVEGVSEFGHHIFLVCYSDS